MKVWTRLEGYLPDPNRPLVLALGNFDGVHVGHQRILKAVVERARERRGIAAALTFFEHPQRVLHPLKEPALLTSPQHRLFLFRERGVELCFLLHFTIPLSKTEPEEFVEEYLEKRLRVREVHMGSNARFGFGRRGDARLMKTLAEKKGFDFAGAGPVEVEGEFVSSSLIRRLIREGNLKRASRLFGRPFSVFATVVRGKGRGRSLGFPTANLRPHSEILPPRGVYPVEVRESPFHLKPAGLMDEFEFVVENPGEWKQGILNYGIRPTFEGSQGEEIPEVFLFDFEGSLYGKTVEVVFHPRVREEREFATPEELMRTIQKDVTEAQRYFRARPTHPLQSRGPLQRG